MRGWGASRDLLRASTRIQAKKWPHLRDPSVSAHSQIPEYLASCFHLGAMGVGG